MMAGSAQTGEASHLIPVMPNHAKKAFTSPYRGSNIQTHTKETATQDVITGMK